MLRHPVTGKIIASKLLEKIDTHEIAWAAGFFDGEGTTGCILSKYGHNPILRITIPQINKENLRRFRKAVLRKGKIFWKDSPNRNIIYVFTSNIWEESQCIIAMLWKYLGDEKKNQIKRAIKKYNENYQGNLTHRRGWNDSHRERSIAVIKQNAWLRNYNGNSTNPPVPATEKAVKVESEEQRK